MDVLEDQVGTRLVVDGVEGGDQVKGFLVRESSSVALFEVDVVELLFSCARSGFFKGCLAQVNPQEATARKALSKGQERAPLSTAQVQHFGASLEPFVEAGKKRKNGLKEVGNNGLTAIFRHDFMEALVAFIGDPAPVLETVDHLGFNTSQDGHILKEGSKIFSAALSSEYGGVIAG